MRRRWRRPGQQPWGKMVIITVAVVLLLFMLEWRLRPTMEAVAMTQAHWVANEAMQKAVLDYIGQQVTYTNLMRPAGSEDGQVVFMQADTMAISKIQAETRLAVEKSLSQLRGKTYYIPLGQVTGLKFLAAYGPPVPLRFVPMGIVNVEVGDTFEAAGINQTRHRIFLQIESEVQVLAPFCREKITVASTVPVAEAIIVGPVPKTYVSLGQDLIKGILRELSF